MLQDLLRRLGGQLPHDRTFGRGGIHPDSHKNLTSDSPIVPLAPSPQEVVLPLSQHIGEPAIPIVEKGARVVRGQKIAEGGATGVPIHASITGKLKPIDRRPHPTLVSAESHYPDGTKGPLVKGANVKGLHIFTDAGRVSFQVIGEHVKVASNDRTKMTADEMKAMADSILSYFGSYTVNEADKSYTMQIESSYTQEQFDIVLM